jgi:hypothetical protein
MYRSGTGAVQAWADGQAVWGCSSLHVAALHVTLAALLRWTVDFSVLM